MNGAPVAPSSATARIDDDTPGAGGSNSTDAATVRAGWTEGACAAGTAEAATASMRAAREPGGGPYATYERLPSSETAIACPLHAAASPYDPSMPYRHGPAPSPPAPMHACRAGAAWAAAAGATVALKEFPAMSRTAPAASETAHSWEGARMPVALPAAASAADPRTSTCRGASAITSTSESARDAMRAPSRPTARGPAPGAAPAAYVTLTSPGRADVRLTASSKYSASVPARRFSRGGAPRSNAGPSMSSVMTGTTGPLNIVPNQEFPAKSGIAVGDTTTVTASAAEPAPVCRSATRRRRCSPVIVMTSSPDAPCEADAPAMAVSTVSDGETATRTVTPPRSTAAALMGSSKYMRSVPSARFSSEAEPAADGLVVSGVTKRVTFEAPANGLPDASWTAPYRTASVSGAAVRCAADAAACWDAVRLATSDDCDPAACPTSAPPRPTTGRPATPAISTSDMLAPGTDPDGAARTFSLNKIVSVGGAAFRFSD